MIVATDLARPTINVDGVVDGQPIRPITWTVFVLCFVVMLSEGFDLSVVGYAAPGIHESFHIVRAQMAPMFSLGLVGMLIGSLGAGVIGDRFGRKRGILLATSLIGMASLGASQADSFGALIAARIGVGIGLGGVLPNVTALMAEFLPRRVRGTFTTYAFMGITVGGILPGLVAAEIAKEQWRLLFVIGGIIPLLALPLLFFLLPESIKFLALRGDGDGSLRKSLRAINPDLALPVDVRFVLDEPKPAHNSLSGVLDGSLGRITPFLWVSFAAIMLVNFFINSWLTLVLHDLGLSTAQAARTASLYYVGGVCGGLFVGAMLDRVGSVTLVLTSIGGAAVAGLISLPHPSPFILATLVLALGFCILGTQVGMSSTAGMLYPTAIRSKGAGLAHSIGRLGAISGPLIAGALISAEASLSTLFLVPMIPLLIAAVSFLALTRFWTGRFQGRGFRVIQAPAT